MLLRLVLVSLFIFTVLPLQALDLKTLLKPDQLDRVVLNPSGSALVKVVTTIPRQDFQLILSQTDDLDQSTLVFTFSQLFPERYGVLTHVAWIDDKYLAITLLDYDQADNIQSAKNKEYIINTVQVAQQLTDLKIIQTPGFVATTLPEVDQQLLYSRVSNQSALYNLDVTKLEPAGTQRDRTRRPDGDQFQKPNLYARVKGRVLKWFFRRGELVAAQVIVSDGVKIMETPDQGKTWPTEYWLAVLKESKHKVAISLKEQQITPVNFIQPGQYYFLSKKTDSDEPNEVLTINLATGKTDSLYQHPTEDIVNLQTRYADNQLIYVTYRQQGEVHHHYFDDAVKTGLKGLRQSGFKGYLGIGSATTDSRKAILFNFAHTNPGQFYLYDESDQSVTDIGEMLPGVKAQLTSTLTIGSIKHDDLAIEYFLTQSSAPGRNPLVVIPHGGPIAVADMRYFDPLTQYLAHQGYDVLTVNYRGSAGYGQDFIEAGYQQWGDGILRDIKAAVDQVTDQNNSRGVCIFGGSFGGYAALMLPIKYPDQFQCAAAFAPVTDLLLLTSPIYEVDVIERIAFFTKAIGDPFKDRQRLISQSPVYQADQIKIPLLVMQGGKDDVVDMEHYYRFKWAAETHQLAAQFIFWPEITHHLSTTEEALQVFEPVVDFLAQHLP